MSATSEISGAVDEILDGFAPAQQADPATALKAWSTLAELGFTTVSVDEDLGGSGGAVSDTFAVLASVGRHGSSAPVADSGFLAGWLCSGAGLEITTELVAVVPPAQRGLTFDGHVVTGFVDDVGWMQYAQTLVALVDGPDGATVVELDAAELTIGPTRPTVAGEPRSRVAVSTTPIRSGRTAVDREQYLRRAAASRVALLGGALEGARDMTVRYTGQRLQFGKPVRSFQAVQVHLALLAEEAALVGGASDLLGAAYDEVGDPVFEVASATLLARSAARESGKAAHQAHGAMGATREYALHTLTRHLWQWAHEHATTSYWREAVLNAVRRAGPDGYYPLITAGTDSRRAGTQ